MHCRDETRERRLGLGWEGHALQVTEYRASRLAQAGDRDWLLTHVHRDYHELLAALWTLGEAEPAGTASPHWADGLGISAGQDT